MPKRLLQKKIKNKTPVFLYVVAGLVILGLTVFFLIFYKTPDNMYVSPENPKQGDAVFIRVKSGSDNITGSFGKSFATAQDEQKLIFYRKGKLPEWIALLGIDADQEPGNYKISVDASGVGPLTKEIKVSLADFSSAPTASAPSAEQTGITKENAYNNIVKNDGPALKKVLNNITFSPYFTGPFSYPLGKMEKVGFSFGKFIGFAKDRLQHLGVDLRASAKTEIYAVNDGKVVALLVLPNYGKTVIIDHGLGIFSLYLHLEEFKVTEGEMVRRGQNIGLSGDTGYSTAPHLHFSIRVGSSRVDPISFIDATKKMNENYFLADLSEAILNIFSQK